MPAVVDGAPAGSADIISAGTDLAELLGDADLGELQGERRINRRPNHPFFLRHHAAAWDVATVGGKPVLLPKLVPHVLMPGSNLVRTTNDTEDRRESYRLAVEHGVRQGWVYLPWSLRVEDPGMLPPGVGPGKYIRDIDCQDSATLRRGKFYTECWNVPVPTPRGEQQQFRFHRESYNAWRAHLVESGVIAPPLESVVEGLVDRRASRVGRVKARHNPDPDDRKAKVETAEAAVKAAKTAKAPSRRKR